MKSVYLALRLVMIAVVTSIVKINVCCGTGINETVIISVTRRIHSDLYHPADSSLHIRCEEQETFMIEERRCVKNENVFKAFYATVYDFSSVRPILHLGSGRSETTLNTSQHHDKASAIDCHIASLEVIRGLEKAFEIDHSGFSFISANSTLKVEVEMLAYNPIEYMGELYHIKFSCAEDENDYIFVVWGTANVTEPKFNCTIPGTLYSHSIDCPAPQTTTVTNNRGPNKGSVAVGTVVGSFAVLALGLLSTFAFVFIKKSKRIKVSAIRSRTLERKSSTMYKKRDVKTETDTANEKGIVLYATPGELSKSNYLYGCGDFERNPAYKEPGISYNELEEPVPDDTVIPRHMNPCYEFTEGPIYQEAISLQQLETTERVTRSRMGMNSPGVTEPHSDSEDVLYEPMEL